MQTVLETQKVAAAEPNPLALDRQLCFALYACSKEVIKAYGPLLSKLDLTYTQYLCMLVLWEEQEISSKQLGQKLFLDSGTLTPLLRKLEDRGYITRSRCTKDARNLQIKLSKKGRELREEALSIPEHMACLSHLSHEETAHLMQLLSKVLADTQAIKES